MPRNYEVVVFDQSLIQVEISPLIFNSFGAIAFGDHATTSTVYSNSVYATSHDWVACGGPDSPSQKKKKKEKEKKKYSNPFVYLSIETV